ncbi:MAG TPA: AMP-binding protein [Solibacterales bacterium]|nr:AMP-binding protein [Bryobacterales bacterium]
MQSYARGPEAALCSDTIYSAFARTAARWPEAGALFVPHQELELTYAGLLREVDRTAGALQALGLQAGDRVGMWATNCAEWLYLQLAAARCGMVLVNVNPAYRAHELAYVLRRSGMKALFLHARDRRSDYAAILDEARGGQTELALRQVIYLGAAAWEEFIGGGRAPEDVAVDPHDVANIQYTSGTTGSPKGVLLTHHNLVNNGLNIALGLKLTERDRICVPVPMYHCFGCVGGTIPLITTGAGLIFPAPSFDPLATLQAIERYRATVIYGVPTMFIAQLDHPEFARFDVTSLRTGIMAGAPCPIEVMKRVVTGMHCPQMTIMYGQTESSPIITGSDVDDPVETRVATVGRAFPNTEVKIAGASGETVPVGVQGELCTRGYLVMKGYDGDPAATARAVDGEGWLHTGDLATMREDGCFRITGRAKDMIIRGGENIYPREIEEFLYTHPKVGDVQVVGLPDAKLGETVAAWIRLKPGENTTEEEIREYCKGRIAHFKVPQYISLVDEFPMTVTGKIQKYRIREIEIERRALHDAARVETA